MIFHITYSLHKQRFVSLLAFSAEPKHEDGFVYNSWVNIKICIPVLPPSVFLCCGIVALLKLELPCFVPSCAMQMCNVALEELCQAER